jgi:hypothetical protein
MSKITPEEREMITSMYLSAGENPDADQLRQAAEALSGVFREHYPDIDEVTLGRVMLGVSQFMVFQSQVMDGGANAMGDTAAWIALAAVDLTMGQALADDLLGEGRGES